MRAVISTGHGGPDVLEPGEAPPPAAGPEEVLVEVACASVNRPDILQREGHYPPPPGASEILGLDIAGRIAAVGKQVTQFAVGDRVMALVAGGGYAELAVAHASHTMRVPDGMSFEEAACVPEAYITAYQNVFINARLRNGETALFHGAGGGVNTAAIQLAKALVPDCRLIVTASPRKLERVRALGIDLAIDYRHEDFCEAVRSFTAGQGADVILDHIGASYFDRNLKSLAVGGRLAVIATMGGRNAEIDLGRLLIKRLKVMGSVLRPLSIADKARVIAAFEAAVAPQLAAGAIRPIVDTVLPLERAADAHRLMEAGGHFGKIVLRVGERV